MKLYIGTTILMYLALSICVLVISLMQLLKGMQLLNTTCILLFPIPPDNAATVIVPLASIYPSLQSP